MAATTYAYVDGGYFRKHFTREIEELFDEVPDINYSALRAYLECWRVFYYDCVDEEGTAAEAERAERIQSQIKAADFYHPRFGTLRGKRRNQKEVDVLLAVDMLTDAFNKNVGHAILLSGDLDFRPALEALVRNGVLVTLVYD